VIFNLSATGPAGGPADYFLWDCNGDGIQDLMVAPGILKMDYSGLSCDVLRLDVTIISWTGPGSTVLEAFDAAGNPLGRVSNSVQGAKEVLMLQSGVPIANATLSAYETCVIEMIVN